MSQTGNFLKDVQIFVNETGTTESALCRGAVGDKNAIRRVREGKSMTLRNVDRIHAFMAAERARRAEPGAHRWTNGDEVEAPTPRRRPWWRRLLGREARP